MSSYPACSRISSSMHAPDVWSPFAGHVAHAALHDEGEALIVLQRADILQGVAIDQQQIREITFLHQAKLVAALHDLATGAGRRLQRRAGREPKVGHEVFEVAGVGALRSGGKAVVAADNNTNAALAHLVVCAAGRLIERLQSLQIEAALRAVVAAPALQARPHEAGGPAGGGAG